MPPDLSGFTPAPAGVSALAQTGERGAGALAARWDAINAAAGVVAALAGVVPAALPPAVRAFPAAIARAGGQRLAVAWQGVDDLAAVLETGIRALLTMHGRGVSPRAPAEALWAEFIAARDALVTVAPPATRLLG